MHARRFVWLVLTVLLLAGRQCDASVLGPQMKPWGFSARSTPREGATLSSSPETVPSSPAKSLAEVIAPPPASNVDNPGLDVLENPLFGDAPLLENYPADDLPADVRIFIPQPNLLLRDTLPVNDAPTDPSPPPLPPPPPHSTASDVTSSGPHCSTHNPFAANPIAAAAQEARFAEWVAHRNADPDSHFERTIPSLININVYWHVINEGSTYEYGNLNASEIEGAIAALNSGVDGSSFNFTLADIDYTTNSNWFNLVQGSEDEVIVKDYRHQGTAVSLNVYSCNPTTTTEGTLGWSTFPWDYASISYYDGVVVDWQSLPGGVAYPYNQGHTLIHEVGHWLGLYHTFQGACCNGATCGDYVADTPAEGSAAYGCPTGRTTCTGNGGDPIWDYMDYTTDLCTEYFTWDQAVRMLDMWDLYRNGN